MLDFDDSLQERFQQSLLLANHQSGNKPESPTKHSWQGLLEKANSGDWTVLRSLSELFCQLNVEELRELLQAVEAFYREHLIYERTERECLLAYLSIVDTIWIVPKELLDSDLLILPQNLSYHLIDRWTESSPSASIWVDCLWRAFPHSRKRLIDAMVLKGERDVAAFPPDSLVMAVSAMLANDLSIPCLPESFFRMLTQSASFALESRQIISVLLQHQPPRDIISEWARNWADKRHARLVNMDLQERMFLCLACGILAEHPETIRSRILEGIQVRLEMLDPKSRRMALLMAEVMTRLEPAPSSLDLSGHPLHAGKFSALIAKESLDAHPLVQDIRFAIDLFQGQPMQASSAAPDEDSSEDEGNVALYPEVEKQRAFTKAGLRPPPSDPKVAKPRSLVEVLEFLEEDRDPGPKSLFAVEALPELLQHQGTSLFLQENGCRLAELVTRIPPDFCRPRSRDDPEGMALISCSLQELFAAKWERNPRPFRRLLAGHLCRIWFGQSGGSAPSDPLFSQHRNLTLSISHRMAILGYIYDAISFKNGAHFSIQDDAERWPLFDRLFASNLKKQRQMASSLLDQGKSPIINDLIEAFFVPFIRKVSNEFGRFLENHPAMAHRVFYFAALTVDSIRHEPCLQDALAASCCLLQRFFLLQSSACECDRTVFRAALLSLRILLSRWPGLADGALSMDFLQSQAGFLASTQNFLESLPLQQRLVTDDADNANVVADCAVLMQHLTSLPALLSAANQRDQMDIKELVLSCKPKVSIHPTTEE